MEWAFLESLSHGKLIALGLTVLGGAFALGAALFKYLSDKRADKIISDTVRRLEDEHSSICEKQKMLDGLIAQAEARTGVLSIREQSVQRLRDAILGSDEELWRMHKPLKPPGYDDAMSDKDPPVIMVANFKGGVGKTTICTNLAAHFATTLAKRVLVIDLDHQGSVSNMLLSSAGITDVKCNVSRILDPTFQVAEWRSLITSLNGPLSKVDLISASPELAPSENKLLLDYLLQEPGPDGRYLLAHLLNSRAMRQAYSLVILDCPPRLTPAMINGLCAATHFLVPTVLDQLSAEAVGIFLASVRRLKAVLNPGLDLLGVVGVMTDQARLKRREIGALNMAQREMTQAWKREAVVLKRHIPHKAAIQAAAGRAIAYHKDKTAHGWFDELGKELMPRLGLGMLGDLVHESETIARPAPHLSGLSKTEQSSSARRRPFIVR